MNNGFSKPLILLVVLLVAGVGAFAYLFWPEVPELIGTDMEHQPAPPFSLTDHRGKSVTLEDLQGKAVALTFIFTNCPDVCPLVVNQMRLAYEDLSPETQEDVALVAITIDPERDSVDVMREFSDTRGVGHLDNWYALTADQETLEPIWNAYFVTPGPHYPADPEIAAAIDAGEHDHEEFIEDVESGEYDGASDNDHEHFHDEHDEDEPYWITHIDVIYLIDEVGNVRVLLRTADGAQALAHNLRILAP